MTRFGTTDLFMEFGDWDARMGRPIANECFLKALLTYGSYDSYHFFCPDTYHREKFLKRIAEIIPDRHLLARIEPTLQIALAETIAGENFEIFHLGDFTHHMPYLVGMRNRLARRPFPITGVTHSLDGNFMNLRYLELLLAGLSPYDGIVCTSAAARQTVAKGFEEISKGLLKNWGKEIPFRGRLRRIPLGIDDDFFLCKADKAAARRFFRIPNNRVVALSVGRLSIRHKSDWAPILELLSRMFGTQEIENMILIIAGGGTDSEIALLNSMISRLGLNDRVMLFPNFAAEVKTKLYQAADFYLSIVDNLQETFGLSVVEAMASGLPVIVSDFSGYREIVTDGKNGLLIPTVGSATLPDFLENNLGILDPSMARYYFSQTIAVDLERLRKAIIHLYQNNTLCREMGTSAQTRASRYRWANLIAEYESFWADLNQEAKARPGVKTKTCDPLVGKPAITFSHYPSRQLSARDTLYLTKTGHQALSSPGIITRYDDIQASIFQELEHLILEQLSRQPQTSDVLQSMALNRLGATSAQVDFHILWLLKHGAIALNPSEKLRSVQERKGNGHVNTYLEAARIMRTQNKKDDWLDMIDKVHAAASFEISDAAKIHEKRGLRRRSTNQPKRAFVMAGQNSMIFHDCGDGFRDMGWEVQGELFGDNSHAGPDVHEKLVFKIYSCHPDLVLSINQVGCDREGYILSAIKAAGIPAVIWYLDNPFALLPQDNLQMVQDAEILACFDSSYIEELQRQTGMKAIHFPLGTNPHRFNHHATNGSKPEWDITFAGNLDLDRVSRQRAALEKSHSHLAEGLEDVVKKMTQRSSGSAHDRLRTAPSTVATGWDRLPSALQEKLYIVAETDASARRRIQIICMLTDTGIKVVGGPEWQVYLPPGQLVAPVDYLTGLCAIYRKSCLNLNISRFARLQLRTGVNQRVFDVPASGSFLLTDKTAELEQYLHPDKEVGIYEDIHEIRGKARYYLTHEQERRAMIKRARRRVLNEHTYVHRMKQLVRQL